MVCVQTGMDFIGAKAALFCGQSILAYLRDDRPSLLWPAHWDLPGGGREADEGPKACLLRELREEFGLVLPPARLVWERSFPSMTDPARNAVFFGGWLDPADIAAIRFGDEGQAWRMMPVSAFLAHDRAVPELQRRVGVVWADPAFVRRAPLNIQAGVPVTGFPERRSGQRGLPPKGRQRHLCLTTVPKQCLQKVPGAAIMQGPRPRRDRLDQSKPPLRGGVRHSDPLATPSGRPSVKPGPVSCKRRSV